VLAMVSATCIGTTIKILLISGYLADRADEIRGLLRPAAGTDSPISVDMFSWERQSFNVPAGFFTMTALRSWGGSILEILVVGVLAIAAWAAAVSLLFQQDAARTPVTIPLAVIVAVVEVSIMVWGTRVSGPRRDEKSPAAEPSGAEASQPGGGAAGIAP